MDTPHCTRSIESLKAHLPAHRRPHIEYEPILGVSLTLGCDELVGEKNQKAEIEIPCMYYPWSLACLVPSVRDNASQPPLPDVSHLISLITV